MILHNYCAPPPTAIWQWRGGEYDVTTMEGGIME